MDFTNREKELLLSNAPVLSRIHLYDQDGSLLQVFNENDYLVDWDYEDFRYVPDQGFIGQFVERLLDGHLMNIPEDLSLDDKEIDVEIAVVDPLLQTQVYHNYGRFIITKVEQEDTTGSYKFESSDYAKKFNVAFKGEEVTYPCTALELLNHACNQAGVKLNSGKNLFDKDNATTLNLIFGIDNHKMSTSANGKSTYINCLPNTTYTISKVADVRFQVATTSEIPAASVSYNDDYVENNTGNKITITTSANANYLVVYYWHNSSTKTEQAVLDTLQVEEGSTATTYEPYLQYSICHAVSEDNLEAGNYYFKDEDKYYNFTLNEDLKLFDSLMLVGNKIVQRKVTNDYKIVETDIYYTVGDSGTGTELECNKVLYVDFTNNNFVVEDNQFEEQDSCRSVVTSIAKLSYTWARINEDNVLKLDFAKKVEGDIDSYNEIDTNKYYEATTTGDSVQPVNKVLIGMSNIEGENIVNEVTSDDIDLNIMSGNTYQKQLSGIQLLKKQGYSTPKTDTTFWGGAHAGFTPLTDGWGKFNYTNDTSSAVYVNAMIRLAGVDFEVNTQYTLIFEFRNIGSDNNVTSFAIYQTRSDEAIEGSSSIYGTISTNPYVKLVTTKSDFTNVIFGIRTFITVPATKTINFEMRASVLKGDYTSAVYDYQPYVNGEPSPNPDFPQPVQVVSGGNTITIHGKNYYNKATSLNNTTFNTNTGRTTVNNNYITSDFIKVQPNTNYYVSGMTVVGAYDVDKGFIGMIRNSNSDGTFITQNNCNYIRIRNYNQLSSETLQNELSDISYLVKGSTATKYEEYQEQEYEIDLGKNLLKEGFRQGNTIDTTVGNRVFTQTSPLVKGGETYTISTNIDTSLYMWAIRVGSQPFPSSSDKYSGDWQSGTKQTITIPGNDGYIGILVSKVGGQSSIVPSDISDYHFQVEEGDVASSYAPYFRWSRNLYDPSKAFVVGGNYQNIRNTIELQPNTDYFYNTGRTYTAVYLYDSNNTLTRLIGNTQAMKSIQFTTASNEVKANFDFYSGQYNVDINSYNFAGVKLELGTINTPYEPYDNHIKLYSIDNYKDKIFITNGKNLANYDDIQLGVGANFNGTEGHVVTNSSVSSYAYLVIPTPSETNVILSIRDNTYSNSKFYIACLKTPNVEAGKTSGWISPNTAFLTNSKTKYLGIVIRIQDSNGSVTPTRELFDNIQFQIEIGSSVTEYNPPGKNDWYIKKSTQEYIFTGLENWSLHNTGCFYDRDNTYKTLDGVVAINNSSLTPLLCDNFISNTVSNTFQNNKTGICTASDGTSNPRIAYPDITTTADFKNWLKTNEVKMIFAINNPQYYKITYQPLIDQLNAINENAQSYNGETYINSRGLKINAPVDITITDIDQNKTSYTGTDIEITGTHEYEPSTITIYDNPLTHLEELRRIAINGSEKLFGLRYTPMEVNSIGHPWLKGNEFMKVTNLEEQDLYFYPFDRKMTYKGYLETTLSAQSKNEVSQKYENKNTIIDRVHHTEIDVDKANGQISLISTQTDENTSDISNLIITTTGISTSVETIQNTTIPTINSNIDNISGDIDTINNQINTIQNTELTNIVSRLSQVEQTAESITNMFQISGGINIIRNSAFLLSDNLWEFTDSGTNPYHTPLGSSYNSTLSGTTTSVAEIKLRSIKVKSKSENITNLKSGTKYTFNFYHKQDNNMTTTIKMYSTEDNTSKAFNDIVITGQQAFKNYEVSFTPTTYSNYTLEIIVSSSASVGYAYLYDMMLNAGDKQSWQPASDEIYSTTLTMSRLGLQVYSVGDGTITLLGSEGLLSYETSDGRTRGRLVSKRTVDGDLVVSTTAQNLYLAQDISQVAQSPSTTPKWVTTVAMVGGRLSEVKYLESGGQ